MTIQKTKVAWILLVLGAVGLAAFSGIVTAQAQDSQTSSEVVEEAEQAPAAAAEQPEAFAAEEVAGQATLTLATVREMRNLARANSNIENITENIPDLTKTVDSFHQDPINIDPAQQTPSLLNEARLQGRRILSRLDSWEKTINLRAKSLNEGQVELRRLREIWQRTAELGAAEEWPGAVVDQIAPLIAEIEETEVNLRQRNDDVLTLQNKISEQVVIITELLEKNESALGASRERILYPNLPPVWRLGQDRELYLSTSQVVQQSWRRLHTGLIEFFTNFQFGIRLHLLSLFVLTGMIFLLYRRARKFKDDDEKTQAVTAILARPFAAAFILTTIFTGLFYPTAPLVIDDLIGILAIPAAARLVSCLVPQSLRRPAYILLGLSLLSILTDMLIGYGPFRRIFLLAVSIFVLVSLHRLNRRLRVRSLAAWPRVIATFVGVGRVVFLVVMLANLGGYVALAEVLMHGTVNAGYAAFLVLAGVRIVEALVMVSLRTRLAQSLASIRFNVEAVQVRISRFVRIAAVIAWFVAVLNYFHVREQVLGWLAGWLDRRWQVGNIEISMASIILFFVVIWITLLVSRIVRNLLNQDILPRANLSRGEADTVATLANYTILALGIITALGAAGIRMEQFALVAGALGVGIGFGLQTIVSNFISGLILIFERPIKMGDTVEVGALLGRVRRIGIRSSTVRTLDGAEVIVPNNDLITGQVVNWTLSDQHRRIEVKVGLAYGTDPALVQELLVGVASDHEKALDNPAPHALFLGFGDSSLDFALRFWTEDYANWITTASEVTVGVNNALKEAGLEIPFPQRDLHVRSIDPPVGEKIWPLADPAQSEATADTGNSRISGDSDENDG